MYKNFLVILMSFSPITIFCMQESSFSSNEELVFCDVSDTNKQGPRPKIKPIVSKTYQKTQSLQPFLTRNLKAFCNRPQNKSTQAKKQVLDFDDLEEFEDIEELDIVTLELLLRNYLAK